MSEPLPTAVFLSGGGTTLQNLIDRIAAGDLPIRIVQVVSSKAKAFGVERARKAGLPVAVAERKAFPSTEAYSDHLFNLAREAGAKLICFAGFLQLVKVPQDYVGRVLNIHPSLLPAFGGKGMYGHHVHEAVLAAGAKTSGCTVHLVTDEYDRGPILLQRTVPVLDGDTPDTLAARVFAEECIAFPEAIRRFVAGECTRHAPSDERTLREA